MYREVNFLIIYLKDKMGYFSCLSVVIATLLGEKRIVTLLCTFRQVHLPFNKKKKILLNKKFIIALNF